MCIYPSVYFSLSRSTYSPCTNVDIDTASAQEVMFFTGETLEHKGIVRAGAEAQPKPRKFMRKISPPWSSNECMFLPALIINFRFVCKGHHENLETQFSPAWYWLLYGIGSFYPANGIVHETYQQHSGYKDSTRYRYIHIFCQYIILILFISGRFRRTSCDMLW